jgi:5'-nucleotidase/UDP-sugar diphosphatase
MDGRHVLELFNTMARISPGDGAFPQVSAGVRLLLNQDTGKCQGAWINGRPVDPQAKYTIATNSYLAAGGDGYTIFQEAEEIYDTSRFQHDVFIEYIKHIQEVKRPEVDHRIQIVGSSFHSSFAPGK